MSGSVRMGTRAMASRILDPRGGGESIGGDEEMSKAVMLSIRPKWCEKIISGEKTVEVRKNRPKLETPFKCYIYETQGWMEKDGIMAFRLGGRVIGEFTCDRIDEYDDDTIFSFRHEHYARWNDFGLNRACMHPEDFQNYADGKWLYGWHIVDLRIYDQPRELSEFTGLRNTRFGAAPYDIKRAPQSWCYVEEG